MLGEPEAVVAAVCTPGLTDKMEDAKNSRYMLANLTVVAGKMGRVLTHYLLEFLPFETEKMTASVWLILQLGLIGAADRLSLGKKSACQQANLVGFLQALPDDLPQPVLRGISNPGTDRQSRRCPAAAMQSLPGQTFLETLAAVLAKLPTQELVPGHLRLGTRLFLTAAPGRRPGPAAGKPCCRMHRTMPAPTECTNHAGNCLGLQVQPQSVTQPRGNARRLRNGVSVRGRKILCTAPPATASTTLSNNLSVCA